MATECTRCLFTDEVPGVSIAADGECSVCKDYDRSFGGWREKLPQRERELQELLQIARGRNARYDVLVPLSGGKDSTYVLYLAVRKYGLRTLAVTLDNGFLSDFARANIQRAVDALGVDHVMFRPSWPALRKLYRTLFLETGFFCPACMHAIEYGVIRVAAGWQVPLILQGTSPRTEEFVAPELFIPASPNIYDAMAGGTDVAHTSALDRRHEVSRRLLTHLAGPRAVAKYSFGALINLPDYLDWNYDEIFAAIRREVGWQARRPDAEHSDCRVEPAVAWMRSLRCPAVTPELPRYSKLVTIGAMKKDEARAKVAEHAAEGEPRAAVEALLEALDITRAQFDEVLADPKRHLRYLAKARGSWRATAVRAAQRLARAR